MREKNIKRVFMCCLTALAANTYAQNFNWVSSTEGNTWKQSKVKLQSESNDTKDFAILQSASKLDYYYYYYF